MSKSDKVSPKPKVKLQRFNSVRLAKPKNVFLYKLRRYAWLLANYNKLMEQDPLAVAPKQYFEVLDKYLALWAEAEKKGLDTNEGRRAARKRVDIQGVGTDRNKVGPPDVGGKIPFSLGTGVPTADPIAEHGGD